MNEHVWISTAAASSENHFQFGWPDSYGDSAAKVKLHNSLQPNIQNGVSLDRSRFPQVLASKRTGSKGDPHRSQLPKKLPPYINWTCPVLERGIVEVICQHDIGTSNFYSVMMHRLDRGQDYDQDFSLLNIGVAKVTLVPEQSTGLYENSFVKGSFLVRNPTQDSVGVLASSLAGSDIWVDPVILNGCFFVSDRLQAALELAGFAGDLQLVRCRIVTGLAL